MPLPLGLFLLIVIVKGRRDGRREKALLSRGWGHFRV
jgi:hypothetical protein